MTLLTCRINVFRGRLGGLFPSIMHSIIVLRCSPGCLNVRSIIFHILSSMAAISDRFFPTIVGISWLLFRPILIILCIRLQQHISSAANAFLSVLFINPRFSTIERYVSDTRYDEFILIVDVESVD